MKIAGIQKTSLIDWPGKVSTVLFTAGCGMFCPYCHNKELQITKVELLDENKIMKKLEERKPYIQYVVLSGGEPTTQEDLESFITSLRDEGFMVKLDTNGMNPKILNQIIDKLDYVALDVKTSLRKYPKLGGSGKKLSESVNIVKLKAKDYEFRTTVVPGFVNEEVLMDMMPLLKGANRYYLQQFKPKNTNMSDVEPFSDSVLKRLKAVIRPYVQQVQIRNL